MHHLPMEGPQLLRIDVSSTDLYLVIPPREIGIDTLEVAEQLEIGRISPLTVNPAAEAIFRLFKIIVGKVQSHEGIRQTGKNEWVVRARATQGDVLHILTGTADADIDARTPRAVHQRSARFLEQAVQQRAQNKVIHTAVTQIVVEH